MKDETPAPPAPADSFPVTRIQYNTVLTSYDHSECWKAAEELMSLGVLEG